MSDTVRPATCARCGGDVARVRFDVHGDVTVDVDLTPAALDPGTVAAVVVAGREPWRVETSAGGVRAGRWGWATADRAPVGVEAITVAHACGDRWPLPAWWVRVCGRSVTYPETAPF